MNREAQDAFDRLEKKVDSLNRANSDSLKKISDFESFENGILSVVDNRLREVQSLIYLVLLLVAIFVALMIGVALKTLTG